MPVLGFSATWLGEVLTRQAFCGRKGYHRVCGEVGVWDSEEH